MGMERRVGFLLDDGQIQEACVAAIRGRLQPDEEAVGKLFVSAENIVRCEIVVSKKRKPRAKKAKVAEAGRHDGDTMRGQQ